MFFGGPTALCQLRTLGSTSRGREIETAYDWVCNSTCRLSNWLYAGRQREGYQPSCK